MSRRGRAFLSGLGVALLFALPLLPEIVGARRLVFRDAHITHWPWRRVAMTMLSSGQAPFVNDTASGGQPLLKRFLKANPLFRWLTRRRLLGCTHYIVARKP